MTSQSSELKSSHTGTIARAVFGVCLVVALLIVLSYLFGRRYKRRKDSVAFVKTSPEHLELGPGLVFEMDEQRRPLHMDSHGIVKYLWTEHTGIRAELG